MRRLLSLVLVLAACAPPATRPTPAGPLEAQITGATAAGVGVVLTRPAYVALVLLSDRDQRGPRLIFADGAAPHPAGGSIVTPAAAAEYARQVRVDGVQHSVLLLASTEPFSAALATTTDGYLFDRPSGAYLDRSRVASLVFNEVFTGDSASHVSADVQSVLPNEVLTLATVRSVTTHADVATDAAPRGFVGCGNGVVAPASTSGTGCALGTTFPTASALPKEPTRP